MYGGLSGGPSCGLGLEEALGDGHLVDYLPGGAGRLARRVAWVVVAIAPAASMRSVACESTFADVFNGDGPGGLGWLGLPLAGCRAVTLMRTAFSGSG